MTRRSRWLLSAAALVLAAVAGHAVPRRRARPRPGRRGRLLQRRQHGVRRPLRLRPAALRAGPARRAVPARRSAWAHDYPRAERNLSRILGEVTSLNPFLGPNGGNVLTLDDPELHKFPFAYMSEPGYWTLNDDEARGLRTWLQKGGFLLFDDFRGDHWQNFEQQLRRVLPDAQLVELDISHPVFHSFFDIDTLEMYEMYGLPVRFYGVYEDNDPRRRLMIVANYNNDIGEYWEFSDTGWYPIDLTNDSYQFGVNYVMYALTH